MAIRVIAVLIIVKHAHETSVCPMGIRDDVGGWPVRTPAGTRLARKVVDLLDSERALSIDEDHVHRVGADRLSRRSRFRKPDFVRAPSARAPGCRAAVRSEQSARRIRVLAGFMAWPFRKVLLDHCYGSGRGQMALPLKQ